MTNNDNFDEVETLDAELEEETPAAAPKPVKKSGGAGKFIVLLAVLGIGGALGAEYMGLIKLPVDIPGVTPAAKVAVNTDAPAAPATPATDTGLPPAAPADLAQGGLPTATGADAVPPAIGTDTAAAPATDSAAAPAITPPSAPGMIPGAVGTQQTDTTKIVAPGNADPFADLPPVPGAPADATAAATPAPDAGKPTITPPAGITAPAGISAPDALSTPAPDALATPDTAASPPATDVTAAVSGSDPLAAAATDPLATPAADPMATTAPATTDPANANPVVAADPAPTGADAATQGKIESLQTQVTTLEQNAATLKAESDAKDAEIAKLKADLAAAKSSSSSASSASASSGDASAATAPKKRRVRAASSNTASPVVSSKVTSRWVLKSAKPGMAWVAPPGSNELKSVAVGDTLAGVGRVTAIAKDEAGRWYVSGTRGRIRQ